MKRFYIIFFLLLFINIDDVGASAIDDGVYIIKDRTISDKAITLADNNENIQLSNFENTDKQKWKIENVDGDYYKIYSFRDNNMALTALNKESENYSINLSSSSDNINQHWLIKSSDNGSFNIISRSNNLYLNFSSDFAGFGEQEKSQNFEFIKVLTSEKSIEEGTYTISSALDLNKKLTVFKDIANSETNVNLNRDIGTWGQIWNVKYLDNGYYSLTSYLDNKLSLDVYGGKAINGANIQLYNYHGGLGQQWIINSTDDGYFNIIARLGNLALDVSNSSTKDGTNVLAWYMHGNNNQKFKFQKITASKKTIEDGIYTISSALDLNKKLTVFGNQANNEANVNLNKDISTWGQIWNVKYLDNGYYSLTSYLDNKLSLDIYGGKAINGSNIQLYNYHSGLGQQWIIKPTGDGYFNIIARLGNLALDVSNSSTKDGTNVLAWRMHGDNNQKFKFQKTEVQRLENGLYTINSKMDLNKVMTVNSSIAFNEANVHLETNKNDNSQKWYITYLKNGYYKITSALNENISLDVYGGKAYNGANIQLFNYHGGLGQQWIIKYVGDGYYSLISSNSSLTLDVYKGISDEGTNLIIWSDNGNDNQKFKFTKATLSDDYALDDGTYTISNEVGYLSIDGQFAYNGTNILMKKELDDSGKWYIKNVGNGLYEVRYAVNQNKVLDVYGGNISDDTNVQIYSNNMKAHQRWYIVRNSDGFYKIISSKSYSPLTVSGGDIKIYSNDLTKNQKFTISKTEDVNYGRVIKDGYYKISSLLNEKMVLDVKNGNILPGANVQLNLNNNDLGQIWNIKYLDNGLYSIVSALNPKRFLTNYNGNVSIEKYSSGDNQKWYISALENGGFSLVSLENGQFLNALSDISIVNTVKPNNTLNQKFDFNLYSGTKIYKGIDISKWQGNINWKLLAQENPHFVIMRVGRGLADLGKDIKFDEYYENATNYDIPVGVYIYSFAENLNDAKKEAEYVIKWLDNRKLDLPVFYDMEHSGQLYLGKEVLTKMAESFCETIISNNYHCGIYANIYWLNNFLDGKKLSSKYPIWLAHWTGANDYNTVLDNFEKYKSSYNLSPYKYWQFSSLGHYQGITENTVDLDFGYDIFD